MFLVSWTLPLFHLFVYFHATHGLPTIPGADGGVGPPSAKSHLQKRLVIKTAQCSVLATCPEGGTQIQNIDITASFVDSRRDGSGVCNWRLGDEMPPRCLTRLTFAQTSVGVPPTSTGNTAKLQWSVNRGTTTSCTYSWTFRLSFDIPERTRGSLSYVEGSSRVTELCTQVRDVCVAEGGGESSVRDCRIDLTGCDIDIP